MKRAHKLQVERAFSLDLWTRMRAALADRAALTGAAGERWRAARALLLILGDGGLRIAEAATARAARARAVAGRRRDAGELAARSDR